MLMIIIILGRAKGIAFDLKGRLISCESGARRVTRTDFISGKVNIKSHRITSFP